MGEVVELDSVRPHVSARIACPHCAIAWQAVFPLSCTELECAYCGKSFAVVVLEAGRAP